MSSRKHKHEEHRNHEAWAIPYGDLMTLLLAFFVVMYAISSVNEGKYRVLSDSMVAAFRGSPRTMKPVQVGEKQVGSGADIEMTIVQQAMLEGQPRALLRSPVGNPTEAAALAVRRMAEEVETALAKLVDANLIAVRRHSYGVEVEIRTDILFPSGSSALSPGALPVLSKWPARCVRCRIPSASKVTPTTCPSAAVRCIPRTGSCPPRARRVSCTCSPSRGSSRSVLSVAAFGEQHPAQIQRHGGGPQRQSSRARRRARHRDAGGAGPGAATRAARQCTDAGARGPAHAEPACAARRRWHGTCCCDVSAAKR